jgi:SAM-dependent methyltransferase
MSSNEDAFDHIAHYYADLIKKYGHDPRACDYGRAESQAIKFKVLSEVLPMEGARVLDVGCGFADYYRYLSANHASIAYTGLDITPDMIAEARQLEPSLDLRCANILKWESQESFDIVTANGIFYLIKDDPVVKMHAIIRAMFDKAKIAVAFNSLSAWASDQHEGEFYADPLTTLSFCRELSPWAVLRHDYHSRDFTIYLYKGRNL